MSELRWQALLDDWLTRPEQPCVEWKENFADPERIGEYISALANMAALEGRSHGYLVWGVEDCSRRVVGTRFDPQEARGAGNQSLVLWLSACLQPGVAFNFDVVVYQGQRLVVLSVPCAAHTPVAFRDVVFLRIDSHVVRANRHPERLRLLWDKLSGALRGDWTAQVSAAEWSDLDAVALLDGRRRFALKHPRLKQELDAWSDERFLSELRLLRDGQLTHAALLLFGQHTAVRWLGGISPRLTWRLKDAQGEDVDYEHFELPLLLSVDRLAVRIRRLKVRILPPRQLAPLELDNYDDWVIREALLNCIAHQDFALGGRVVVTERPDSLELFNYGGFLPGNVERVLDGDFVEGRYRNPCLADAMLKIDLIDTAGSGIRRMYRKQRERLFPLPDYEFKSNPDAVVVRLYGREIDTGFSSVLLEFTDLGLDEVIALDAVQKQRPVDATMVRRLRSKGLVEGRGKSLSISGPVARMTGQEVRYTLDRGLDAQHYKGLILSLLNLGPQRRRKINELLWDKLPDAVPVDKRGTYIKNLLQEMAYRDQTIETDGGQTQAARWRIKAR